MSISLKDVPFFDHHTHLLDGSLTHVSKSDFLSTYLHGFQDRGPWDYGKSAPHVFGYPSDRQIDHLANLGVIKVTTHFMSQYFDCEPTVDAVLAARNKLINNDRAKLKAYTRALYEDANVCGTVLDSPDPWGDTKHEVFPGPVYRLYNYEDDYFALLKAASSYDDLMEELLKRARKAIADGFIAIKGHLAETFTFAARPTSDQRAAAQFVAAQQGDHTAGEDVFFAAFGHILELCVDLDICIHIHTGVTSYCRPSAFNATQCDPFIFVPFLTSNEKYLKAKIVLLHCWPYHQEAAQLSYSFGNIYLDASCMNPWHAVNFPNVISEYLGICPHSKRMLGTGQHHFPEFCWAAAKIARASLEHVFNENIKLGMLTDAQAMDSAVKIMNGNVRALYHLG